MSVVDDVRRTVQAGSAAFGAVQSVVEWTTALRPLADAALRGDRSAYAELERLATDPRELPAVNAAARVLLEYVKVRQTVGTTATKAGLGLYPGQVNPLVLVGIVLLVLTLWRRR